MYEIIWNTRTREPSKVLSYLKDDYMKRTFEDGTLVWQDTKPVEEPERGSIRCLLHSELWGGKTVSVGFHKNGLRVLEIMPVCRKSNISDSHNLTLHMHNRHARETMMILQAVANATD